MGVGNSSAVVAVAPRGWALVRPGSIGPIKFGAGPGSSPGPGPIGPNLGPFGAGPGCGPGPGPIGPDLGPLGPIRAQFEPIWGRAWVRPGPKGIS